MQSNFNQPKIRQEVIDKLTFFLCNPGNFSILVLGKHGVGKTHWLNELRNKLSTEKCLSTISTINCGYKNNLTELEWLAEFEKAKDGLLIFDDAHKLTKSSQEILFEILSTHNGKYGLEEKSINCRVAFTSTRSIKTLRENREFWNTEFFDRVAQLVVEFPSYEKGSLMVKQDFAEIWENMKFKQHNSLPGNELIRWLENHGHQLHGNLRDLQKIAINWHQYRLMNLKEEEILSKITLDFNQYFHYPEQSKDDSDGFFLKNGDSWDDIDKRFKAHAKKWANTEYGNLKAAAKVLGMGHRTFERW
jgi:transcriptional regulator with AAA-type ATPase domain